VEEEEFRKQVSNEQWTEKEGISKYGKNQAGPSFFVANWEVCRGRETGTNGKSEASSERDRASEESWRDDSRETGPQGSTPRTSTRSSELLRWRESAKVNINSQSKVRVRY
jgi:hypothetical protein